MPEPPQNIILTGFMGTGKTSVARELASRLGWTMLDVDDRIEARAGKPIEGIFAQDGEATFREIERACAAELPALKHHVVATGGGLAVDPANLRQCLDAGATILLEASPQTIYDRVAHETHRPLLQHDDPRARIEDLLARRREAYARVPIRIATDGKSTAQLATEIIERLEMNDAKNHPVPPPENRKPLAEVQVALDNRSYPIAIGANWLDSLVERMTAVFPPRPVALVTEPNIGQHWERPVGQALSRAGYDVLVVHMPGGEQHKNLETVSHILDSMLKRRFSRQAGLIALGGGIVGDVAGYAAASMLRGIAYIQMPTSLLAMVDSSVGGKTGVNHAMGKNLIGAFWQPTFVGVELEFLSTLPEVELRCGLAEAIKAGVLADAAFFEWMEDNVDRALARDPDALAHVVRRSAEIKADIVAQDERETTGVRAKLNFGHTFGHAAEALGGYEAIRHGEGVGMGMVAAASLAAARGMLDEGDFARIERLVERAGLPTRMLHFVADEYWARMGSDKKVKDGVVRFILPSRIGEVTLVDDVTFDEAAATLERTMAPRGLPRPRPLEHG